MFSYQQAKELRAIALPQLAARKPDLQRILKDGPKKEEDYKLLVSVIAFALGEVSIWEGENQTGIKN